MLKKRDLTRLHVKEDLESAISGGKVISTLPPVGMDVIS